jgi:hypothetical protein
VHSRFISTQSVQQEGVFSNGQNSHRLIHQFDEPGMIYGKLERIRTYKYPGVLALDAGSVNNSFSLAAGHYNFDTGKTVVTTLLECMPQQGRRIDFNLLYTYVILPLAKELNVVGVAADQWQSIDLLHRIKADMGNNPLQKPRCLATQYSPKRKDFEAFRGMLEAKNILMPTVSKADMQFIIDGHVADYRTEMLGKPVEHTLLQMITVRDVGEARCPEKGEGMTDDIFRALVLLINKIHTPKIMDRLVEAKEWVYEGQQKTMPKPVYVSRGGFRYPGLR